MSLCTRCGRQMEDGAEFCSGCGGYPGPGPAVASRPLAGPAMTAAASYLRPFAAEQSAAPQLPRPASEPAFLAERSQQPRPDQAQDWPVQSPSGRPADFTSPPGPSLPAAHLPGASPLLGPAADGYFAAASGTATPAPDSPPKLASMPPDSQPPWTQAIHDLPSPGQLGAAGRPATVREPFVPAPSPPAAAEARWQPTQREAYDSRATSRDESTWQPRGYPAWSWPAQQEAAAGNGLDAPPLAAPDDDEADQDDSWPASDQDEAPGRRLRRRNRAQPSGDPEARTRQPAGLHNARWVSIAAASVVLIMAAAIVTILLAGHGKPGSTAGAGRPASTRAPRPSSPPTTPPATGGGLIAVAPGAAAAPDAPAVESFLTRYFRAINDHSYPAYRRLFSAAIGGSLSAAAFQTGYGSSRDSHVTLLSITGMGAGQLAAAVTFTSHQQPAATPTHSACTAWSITIYLVRQRGGFVIEPPPAGYSATSSSCS
jgi:hypothetical protein